MRKICIITGARSGMGKEFAIQIAEKYQNLNLDEIWLLARRKEKLDSAKNEILKIKNAPKVKNFQIDLSGTEGSKNYKKILDDEFQKQDFSVELLVNNAGFGTYGPFENTPVEKELQMIELNCVSFTGVCGYTLPFMKENSTIINTSSLASFAPLGNFAVYAATKSFTLSFSIALSAELKHRKIKVCALCPGSVSTEFANVASNGARKEVLHGIEPEKVVSDCLKKAFKNKKIAVFRFKWKCSAFFSRFVSRFFVANFMYKNCKRPYKNES